MRFSVHALTNLIVDRQTIIHFWPTLRLHVFMNPILSDALIEVDKQIIIITCRQNKLGLRGTNLKKNILGSFDTFEAS